ncbi:MAG TPA: hypothetical protein VE863_12545 [Pyrinomonadaceae bacterium]|jgi:hypothetical protein|nr:hypothetical protein [Pyrinomonadaceae bacterium]
MTIAPKDQRPAAAGRSDPTIHLALTHDWEIRGDGSGDIEEIQFAPMRRLLSLYRKSGARTTFMPDVMQQRAFRKLQQQHEVLAPAAETWEGIVREAYAQGHDIQLHLHSQWSHAEYANGRWHLKGSWSLLDYDQERAAQMIAESKTYLEDLMRTVDPAYRCVAFRASALALAPSPHLLSSLASLGIELDVSMAAGFYLNNETLQLDYRKCEETFLPYYPRMEDARRVSAQPEPIVCVPLNHFYGSRREVAKQNLKLAAGRMSHRGNSSPTPRAQLDTQRSGVARVFEKLIAPAIKQKYFVSDVSRLNYRLMKEMLASIRARATESGLSKIPVVLTNHPKDIRDWDAIEKFVGELADANDIEFITLADLAAKIRSGEFQVKKK